MTPFQRLCKALEWREELLCSDDASVFGYVDVLDSEECDVFDLVRVVSIDGVNVAVPIRKTDLDGWELARVQDSAAEIADRIRDAIAEDNGYDG